MSTPTLRSTVIRCHYVLQLNTKRHETTVNSTEYASESRLLKGIILSFQGIFNVYLIFIHSGA